MTNGTVKWFNSTKGYGFITPENGDNDVFIHISEVSASGLSQLRDGQKVSFDIASNNGKQSAVNLTLVEEKEE